MDISAYLQRIRYSGALQPSAATLRALHLAHLYAVPFENLDIHLKRPIVLDIDKLFDKIVRQRRGGFCYELNGLFAYLLLAMGFDVTYLSASDAQEEGGFGPEFDHLVLFVRSPERPSIPWLADVGWGDTFREPLQADQTGEQFQDRRVYRLEPDRHYRILWQRDESGRTERQYRFTFQPRMFHEFEPMCRYHQTSPESHFTQKRICTLATVNGRITLDDSRLITTIQGKRHERAVGSEQERHQILRDQFGIDLKNAGELSFS